MALTANRTGCDVLVQSHAASTCRGFTNVAVARPVRILVRAGVPSSAQPAAELADALGAVLKSLGTNVATADLPCKGRLRDPCMAQGEAQTLNVLTWVGSATAPDAAEDAEVANWLRSRPDAAAVAVLPLGQNPDVVVPAPLRDRQVVWWAGSPYRAALDVLAAAEVVAAERSVFISYSHADGIELAHAVFDALSRARFSVFLDAFGLAPGSDFAERIEHRLLDAAFLVLIETKKALESNWILRELAFARRHRLGLAAVSPGSGGPVLPGIGRARRWALPSGGLVTSSPNGPALITPVADDLRDFVTQQHAEAMLRRRQALDGGLRAALRRAGVADGNVAWIPGGLDVDAGGRRWAVSLRPRPATLVDMHVAARQAPAGHRGVMVSATPRGRLERESLEWLAAEADLPHWDEGRLLSLALGLVTGAV